MLLYSVSIITNFVIPKCDKQKTDKKYHTFSSKAGTRPTIPTTVGTVIEEVRAIYAPPKFLDPISTFASRVY